MSTLVNDINHGIRMLIRKPGSTFIAIIALAVGIGATSLVFSVVDTILMRPLPYKDPHNLAIIWQEYPKRDLPPNLPISPPNFAEIKSQNRVFENIGALAFSTLTFTGRGEPERMMALRVSAGVFQALGVNPLIGRYFLPEEDKAGSSKTVVLSHAIWQRRFSSDPNIVGSSMTLDDEAYTIIGVMPPDFQLPPSITVRNVTNTSADLWVSSIGSLSGGAGQRRFYVVGRLKPGATIEQARADLAGISKRLEQAYPGPNTGLELSITTLREQIVGTVRPMLLILFGAVLFVLLTACANVASMQLANGVARQTEIAIRAALGATRLRIIRQMLTESIILSLIGGLVGLLLASGGLKLLVGLNPENIPRMNEVSINRYVFGFTLVISFVAGGIFGIIPALRLSKPDLIEMLKDVSRSTTGGLKQLRLRGLLVITEVALALVLLIGAILLIRSFLHLQQVNLGFNVDGLLVTMVSMPESRYADSQRTGIFLQQALQKFKSLPGTQSAAVATGLPTGQSAINQNFRIVGRPAPPPGENPHADVRVISSEYFQALGISLRKGRFFTDRDSADTPKVAVINEDMARRFWPSEDPIGKLLMVDWLEEMPREIVGIIADVKKRRLDTGAIPEIYLPYPQVKVTSIPRPWRSNAFFIIRSAANPSSLAAPARNEIWSLDRDLAVSPGRTMSEIVSDSIAQIRFSMVLLQLFAGIAVIIAAVGIYGIMSHSVTQRMNEIGVRMALGAQPTDVLKLILRQGMTLSLLGIVIGLFGAFAATRILAGLVYGVSVSDFVTFIGSSLILILIAFLSCYYPARRATKLDPAITLRRE